MISITDKEFKRFSDYIKANYGIYLKQEKRSLIMGRLQNVLLQKNYESFSQYFDYVLADKTGNALVTLIDKVTTNHTFFMREPEHFIYFKNKILPELSSNIQDRDLRIWSAGCSSGEEPYTLAMLMNDYYGNEKALWDTKILATDISSSVLKTAVNGEYANDRIHSLPEIWKSNYFKRSSNGSYMVADKIKDEVIFRKFNLMQSVFPFKRKFHVIFCRNVMIYFDNDTRRKLVNKFYEATESGGYLFIGHSESLTRGETKYKYVMPAVYRKE